MSPDPNGFAARWMAHGRIYWGTKQMLFKKKQPTTLAGSLRVTPTPDAAAALERKFAALSYNPGNGFHRDHAQLRRSPPRLKLIVNRRAAFPLP